MSTYAVTEAQSKVLDTAIADLLVLVEAQAVFMCDSGGNLIAYNTIEQSDDSVYTIAALAAGSFTATRQLAALIKEPSFQSIFHQGERTSIYLQSMGTDFLILVIFGRVTPAGLVKLYVDKAAKELDPVLRQIDAAGPVSMGAIGKKFELNADAIFKKPQK